MARRPDQTGGSEDGAAVARQPRLDGLTGLRWWAAFLVFGYHMLVFAPIPGPLAAVLGQGYLGVTFFFVLSGFVLTWSWSPRVSTATFYWRRVARIYPAHLVALALAIPVFYDFGVGETASWVKPFDAGVLALSIVLIQGWWLAPAILFSGNPAAWTLTCEAFFYAVHPWASRVLTRRSRRGALALGGAVIVAAFGYRVLAAIGIGGLAQLPLPLVRVSEFLLGMCLAWAIRQGWRARVSVWLVAGLTVGLICAIAWVPAGAPGTPPALLLAVFGNELATLAFAALIVAVASAELTRGLTAFSSASQVRLGEISFAFYLVHATGIYLALTVFGPQSASWSNLGWYALLFAVDLAAAWALYRYVERPVEKRMRNWKDRRDDSRAALVREL